MELIKEGFLSSDGKTRLSCYFYVPENPRAVIQLSHGMCEYVERYASHAEYFASQGFVFCGHDHLGHGSSAATEDDLGYTVSADCLVDDLKRMTDKVREKYPSLPIFLLGHSMGSFIARCYLTKYSDALAGAIISGTAGKGNPTGIAKLLCRAIAVLRGERHRSEFIKSISTGSYYKKFGKDAPRSAWVTSNDKIREQYDADPLCSYTFTLNGYYNMFDLLGRVSSKKWASSIDLSLPLLLIGGVDDPVGGEKGINEVADRLNSAGATSLTVRLWQGARHELLNETDEIRDETYKTVTDWINERI